MARGINLQAVSTDGSLDFNVYIFNVQPGYQFNYQNGRASKDNSVQVANWFYSYINKVRILRMYIYKNMNGNKMMSKSRILLLFYIVIYLKIPYTLIRDFLN